MDAYSPLLEKIRIPQPSFQKLAVISIFEKLRSAPPHLGPDSHPGSEAIAQCLLSASPAVVDQSVRELCRLVRDSKLDVSRGLLDLQSALEATASCFVNLFVKGLGYLVRLGFRNSPHSFQFQASETHPFVMILSCRKVVQPELVRQVLIFLAEESKQCKMVEVCRFLTPFLNYAIVRMSSLVSLTSFVRDLLSSIASLCCSLPHEALPIIKLLIGRIKYFPCKNEDDYTEIFYLVECIVDACSVVLRQLVGNGLLVHEAQLCSAELLDAIFSLHNDLLKPAGSVEYILEVSRRLLVVQKELGLSFLPELSSAISFIFIILVHSELEHEQLSVVKLLCFILRWKNDSGKDVRSSCLLNEELLFIFPVINLVYSPSKSVKQAAIDLLSVLRQLSMNLLVATRTEVSAQKKLPSISTSADVAVRLLQSLWLQDQTSLPGVFYLNLASGIESSIDKQNKAKTWTSMLSEYMLRVISRRKSSLSTTGSHENLHTEMPLLLSGIACVLLTHQTLGHSAGDLLAICNKMDPKLGVPFLLVILFYNHMYSENKNAVSNGMQLKLLGMLPSLASHPAMLPLVVQTILPMLQKDANSVLYATAIRLICKTWECNDRVFGSLQGVLHANKFAEFVSDREIYISMALSICDVCRKDPDRGVDLILSVEACIEHQDYFIQSLGLESLAHLCEADVVDFYTAWDVIAKQLNYLGNATVACSLCHLLRWGAMDAESYTEAASGVVEVLWEIGTSPTVGHGWSKARASAFEALTHYEVGQFQGSLPDFNERNLEFLTSETDPEVLRALEAFEVKIINHEHITRRRLVKQKRLPKSKIEKLLDVFPQVMFASGNDRKARELPGAALFCLSFNFKGLNMPGASEALQDVQHKYKNAVVEIADSLQLSRNVLIALLALQSWKPFMQRWIRAHIISLDTKVHSAVLDKTSKAAKEILKCLIEIAEKSPPRSAENIALAIGALCSVLPLSDHAIKSTASKFLLSWLFQHEHEYRQWSAAISLGLISNFLHVTDRKQKVEYINALLEVLSVSKSTLVKGACGVGLGFSCQDFLTKSDAEDNFHPGKGAPRMEEIDLLKKIIGSLSRLICPLTQSSSDILKNAFSWLQLGSDDFDSNITPKFLGQSSENFGDDVWGVAGLILGLGSSVSAIYKAGFYDAVLNLKTLLISWIPNLNPSIPFPTSAKSELLFSVGACLAAPIVMAFCHRVELVDGTEIDQLVGCYKHLISELVSVQNFSTLHQSLLMASCIGAGSLLGTILNGSLHALKVEHVKDLLALFRKSYSDPNPPFIHLGGTIGAVNALGAGAGTLIQHHPSSSSHATNDQKKSAYINCPLLSSPALEPDLTSLVQEIFLVAQNPDVDQLQQYAAWAISFLRHSLQLQELHYKETTTGSDVGTKNVSHSFSEDSTVLKLSLWLIHLKHPGTGNISHVSTVSMVLRCLTHAPRLPSLDWGAIIRRFMRYESEVAELLLQDVTFKKGHLREECLLFSLSHASQFDHLLVFLDELCELARMRTLEPTLQSCILVHLADLTKIFSSSRLVKLFKDVACFVSWLVSSGLYSPEQKSSLRFSCWRGLNQCLNESSLDTQNYKSAIENCMEVLFNLLPQFPSAGSKELYQANIIEEWSEAIRCIGKSQQGWLLDLLQISEVNLIETNGQFESVKKIQVKSRLVQTGSVPLSELGKLKAYILNCKCEVIWDALLGVVETLQYADGSVKRQWLVNAMEISCVSRFPSTALRFIGLLCGNCCRYMPVLVVDQMTVLSDLPITLTSLLSDSNWAVVAESVVSHLWSLTVRIYNWEKHTADDYSPNQLSIDSSEYDKATFLFQVLHHSCILLKDYLPPEKLLQLANMVIH